MFLEEHRCSLRSDLSLRERFSRLLGQSEKVEGYTKWFLGLMGQKIVA
jgi:hypothetical protein